MTWSSMFAAVVILGAAIVSLHVPTRADEKIITEPLWLPGASCACNRSLVIVSTLDGRITALDADNDGDELWTMQTNRLPLLQSTLSKIEILSGDLPYRLLPALDGSLYMYNELVTHGIPISVESLLSSSTKIGSDVIVGSKDITTYGVDPVSGQVFYTCSSLGCEKHASENFEEKVVIRRVSQVVRAVDASTGYERWNVTVGEHQVLLANGYNTISPCDGHQYERRTGEQTQNIAIKVVPPDGIVFAVQRSSPSKVLWSQKFDSPIAKVWTINSDGLQELSLFDPDVVPALQGLIAGHRGDGAPRNIEPMIYMGNYGSEHYVIPSAEERKVMELFAQSRMGSALSSRLYLAALAGQAYRPSLLSSDSSLYPSDHENCVTCSAKKVNEIVQGDHEQNSGWYLYNLKSGSALQKWTRWDKYLNERARREQKYLTQLVVVDMWDWWKHAFVVCFTLICIPQIFVFIYVFKKRSDVLVTQKSDDSSVKKRSQESMTDFSSSTSGSTESEFTSRFLKDFVAVRCLGCGGFGTVVESINKVDEQKYAVKRIPLPNRRYAKERVIREVKALAKLDHPGIVRYYNSWFEEPPAGWLESPEAAVFNLCRSKQWSGGTESRIAKDHSSITLDEKVLKPKHRITGSCTTLSALAHNQSNHVHSTRFNLDEDVSSDSLEIVFQKSERKDEHSSLASRGYDLISRSIDLSLSRFRRQTTRPKAKKNKELQTVPVRDVFLFIQMQLCREYTLMDWLGEHIETRDLPLMLDWFKQIVEAMQYVHDCGMIHRDLKPTNIFFSLTGQVKIGDFGLVKECLTFEQCEESDPDSGAVSSAVAHTQNVGTYLYMSPEQETKGPYTFKVDIYALGMIFVELVIPFATQMERIVTLKSLRQMKLPEIIQRSTAMCSFVMKTLSHSPEERPSCKAILSSPLFTELL